MKHCLWNAKEYNEETEEDRVSKLGNVLQDVGVRSPKMYEFTNVTGRSSQFLTTTVNMLFIGVDSRKGFLLLVISSITNRYCEGVKNRSNPFDVSDLRPYLRGGEFDIW